MELDQITPIGRRIREIRTWRSLSLKETAELAGLSESHLSNIERGRRQVDKRSTLDRLAAALRVAPSELAAQPFPAQDFQAANARVSVGHIETVVAEIRLGDAVAAAPRPWPEIQADLDRLESDLRPRADYAGQGALLPGLLEEIHAVHGTMAQHRTDALLGLATCYHTASILAKNHGARGVAQLAADRALTVAERLGSPEHIAHAEWVRSKAIGGVSRERQLALVRRTIDAMRAESMSPELTQAVGQLHFNAALAAASLSDEDAAWGHYREAEALAERQTEDVGMFGHMWFGRANARIWQVTLATEFGYGGKVAELAEGARPERIPSTARQAEFWADLGRSLADDRKTRPKAVSYLRKAEDLAPQLVRSKPFIREAVVNLVNKAQNDTVGRELRGMAHRMGLGV